MDVATVALTGRSLGLFNYHRKCNMHELDHEALIEPEKVKSFAAWLSQTEGPVIIEHYETGELDARCESMPETFYIGQIECPENNV